MKPPSSHSAWPRGTGFGFSWPSPSLAVRLAAQLSTRLAARILIPSLTQLGLEEIAANYTARFAERGASFIFLGGTTPAPSYVINLIAGATGYPFGEFLGIFSASRLVRFGVLGGLLFVFGAQITGGWKRLPNWLKRGLTLLIVIDVGVLVCHRIEGLTLSPETGPPC